MFDMIKKNNYLKAFLLSLIMGLIIIGPSIIMDKGILTLVADFNYQQIPFNILTNNLIKEGNLLWNWYTDIGSSFIGSFSFYNIGSPFFWITLIFPASWFPYLIGPMLILKYAVAGLTSFAFLQRYTKNKNYALIGSLLYAFSGFQLTNMLFNHFHDVVALFPLLLLGLDKLVYDNKKGWFAFSVAILALTNYFFFIGQVVFVIIYFIVKVVTKEYKINLRKFIQIFLEALIGVGISAFLLLPSLVFVVGNPRIDGSWNWFNSFIYIKETYLEILRALIMPSEVMSNRSMIYPLNFYSVEAYLPFVGSVLFLTYLWKRPKKWISVLMIVSLIFMFVPILNSAFFAFTIPYYARWFYMPILIFALASIKTMEENLKIKSGLIITIILYIILIFQCYLYKKANLQFIFDRNYFYVVNAVFLISVLLIFIFYNFFRKNKSFVITLGVIISIGIMGNLFFWQNKQLCPSNDSYIKNYLNARDYIDINLQDGERIDASESCSYNLGNILKQPVIKSWNSTINGSVFNFHHGIDNYRRIYTGYANNEHNVRDFLSVRYIISCSKDDNEIFTDDYKLISQDGHYNVYENIDYLKMGIAYDYYILLNDFQKLDFRIKRQLLTKAIVINSKQLQKYDNVLQKVPEECLLINSECNFLRARDNHNLSFEITKLGFQHIVNVEDDTIFLYSVPYDAGWSVKINNKNADIELVNSGLMAIKVKAGMNKIDFVYFPKELKAGLIISLSSLIGLLVYLRYYKTAGKI